VDIQLRVLSLALEQPPNHRRRFGMKNHKDDVSKGSHSWRIHQKKEAIDETHKIRNTDLISLLSKTLIEEIIKESKD